MPNTTIATATEPVDYCDGCDEVFPRSIISVVDVAEDGARHSYDQSFCPTCYEYHMGEVPDFS